MNATESFNLVISIIISGLCHRGVHRFNEMYFDANSSCAGMECGKGC